MFSLPLLHQREIEAKALAPFFHAVAAEIGEPKARELLANSIRELARQAGCSAAAAIGGNDLTHLKDVVKSWCEGEALEIATVRDDEAAYEFNVTRCRFAEMYQRLGLTDLGPLLSCNRDGAMIEGFNPGLALTRTQTIMQGAAFCDFRYRTQRTGIEEEK